MRFLAIAFAVVAVVGASTLPADYLPPLMNNSLPEQEYLAPTTQSTDDEQTILADDGYRYKVVRLLKYRQRRDVNELNEGKYLPPSVTNSTESPNNEYLPAIEETDDSTVVEVPQSTTEVSTQLTDDGYRYKVVRRLKYRHRRDVSELPQNEYLPPNDEIEETPLTNAVQDKPEETTQLANDGYRYRVVRRLKYRQRRDVNELPQNEYLPPAETSMAPHVAAEPIPEDAAGTVLTNDGYRYKVVRRLKYRHRRDVNELPLNDYLPPPTAMEGQNIADEQPHKVETTAVLTNDGYQYKTVRRLKYRRH